MCWNKEISLSTFVLACAAIWIGRINGNSSTAHAVFYLSVALMQLLEYFVWARGLRPGSRRLNRALSVIGLLLIVVQPVAAGFLIERPVSRAWYFAAYGLWVAGFAWAWARSPDARLQTSVATNGHLRWHWLEPATLGWVLSWTAFVVVALCLSRCTAAMATLISLFIVSFTLWSYWSNIRSPGAWGSVYCSAINVMFVFILVKCFLGQYTCLRSAGC